jgi:hypothetical protein
MVSKQTATFGQRQSTREENFALARKFHSRSQYAVFTRLKSAVRRDGQFLDVRPCEALAYLVKSDVRFNDFAIETAYF